jgi:hypothetical protein
MTRIRVRGVLPTHALSALCLSIQIILPNDKRNVTFICERYGALAPASSFFIEYFHVKLRHCTFLMVNYIKYFRYPNTFSNYSLATNGLQKGELFEMEIATNRVSGR